MANAISYVRWSSSRQSLGDSLRRQLELSRDYCKRHGITLDESFRLVDSGVSAFKGKNSKIGALAQFLTAVESKRVPSGSVLIVESLDRLSREEISEALELFLRILRNGVEIVTLSPERRHTKDSINDLAGLLEPLIIMSRANEESTIKSQRGAAVWKARRELARQGKPIRGKSLPFWIRLQDDKPVLDPEYTALVRHVFELKAKGYGVQTILNRINVAGFPRAPRGNAWNPPVIHRLISERCVLGEYQPCRLVDGKKVPEGEPIQGYYPQAVSLDLWHKANQSLAQNRRGRSQESTEIVNIFQGRILNANDGATVHCLGGGPKTGPRFWYLKSSAAIYEGRGDKLCLPYRVFERAFLSYVSELDPKDFTQDGSKIHAEIAEMAGKLAEIEHRSRILKDRIKSSDPSKIETLLDLLGEISEQEQETQKALERLKSQASNASVDTIGEVKSLAILLDEQQEESARRDLRIQIRTRIAGLVEQIVILPTKGEKKLAHNRNTWTCLVAVFFYDGTERRFITDQDGNLTVNVKFPSTASKAIKDARRVFEPVGSNKKPSRA